MNPSEVITSFNEIVSQANAGKQTAEQVAKALIAEAEELRGRADRLVKLARQLTGNISLSEPINRKTILLKEGESLRRKKAKEVKPTKPKYHKPTQAEIDAMTPERRAKYLANVERCAKMREAKQQKALVEKFAETKIS